MELHWRLAWSIVALVAFVAGFSTTTFAQTPPAPTAVAPARPASSRPSIVMLSSYVATAVVQSLDAHSTFKALDTGAVEQNPLIGPLAANRAAFLGLKAAIAAALIYEGHSTGKQHRIRAVLVLAAIDSAYIALARHNYQVARIMKQ